MSKCKKELNPFPLTGVGWIECELEDGHEGPHEIKLEGVNVYDGKNVYPDASSKITWESER